MKPRYVLLAALATSSLIALAAAPEKLPPQWVVTGPTADKYAAGIDQSDEARGAKFIRSTTDDSNTWGALTQMISAQNYLGQRVRFSARVRTKDSTGGAGLWMRVDGPGGKMISLYNSGDKTIKGTNEGQQRGVVLDVPNNATAIAFGVIEWGTGQVWIDSLSLKELADTLDAAAFWQIHRGYMVAVKRIASATRGEDGALWVNLRGHAARLPVSQRFQHLFKGM